MKIAFYTIGCKVNYAETATISRYFKHEPFHIVDVNEFADIYVVNTCTVTVKADIDLKKIVNKVLNINKKAYIIAIGCYAQVNPSKVSSIKGINLVLGATEKFKIFRYIYNIYYNKIKNDNTEIYSCNIKDINTYETSYSLKERTRSFLKIQDGCNYKCSYCTIPLARGTSRSGSITKIISNIKEILKNNIKEIVLTGINIGDYGIINNIRKYKLIDLIRNIEHMKEKYENIFRIRISSIEPNLLTDNIITFISQSSIFNPHFHIPLQSGSDYILNKMRRRYSVSLYLGKILKIKSLIPYSSIGVDVIVGFPGETEKYFLETYNFIQSLDVSYLHVFTYSERDNTFALQFVKDSVPIEIRNYRNKLLRILSFKKKINFYSKNISTIRNALFENNYKNGFIYGYTDNYIKIKHTWSNDLVNQFKNVYLKEIDINDESVLVDIHTNHIK